MNSFSGGTYQAYFERNYGIFDSQEQERIRNARVVIIGSGGIGGLVAVAFSAQRPGAFRAL